MIDINNLSQEIIDNYEVLDNALKATPKDDPKDRIEIELGDSKDPSTFQPQFKLMRWDNEVNASFRLVDSEPKTLVTEGDKVKLIGDKKEVHLYELPVSEELKEGGFEFEIVLKEKPLTNKIEFSIETKELDFRYQSELTKKQVDAGDLRPENVVRSYAVYHKTRGGMDFSGGKSYKAGKAFHIYRPRIEDAEGSWVWGELNIENNLLTVTIPQEFLDNAVYPIRHAAGLLFGNSNSGGSTTITNSRNHIMGFKHTCPGVFTALSISLYMEQYSSNTPTITCALYKTSDWSFAVATEEKVDMTPASQYHVFDFSGTPGLENIEYAITFWSDALFRFAYDGDGSDTIYRDNSTAYTGTFPSPFGGANGWGPDTHIYCTYEAAGPSTVVQDIIGPGIVAFPR